MNHSFFEVKKYLLFVLLVLSLSPTISFSQLSAERQSIISVDRIWDRAQHNAFTSLIRFNDKFYVTFRESAGHVSSINGTIRVISSADGQNWLSVAHLDLAGVDLRDPQLSVTPDNKIMLNYGGSVYIGTQRISMRPFVSFSDVNGNNFTKPYAVEIDPKIKTEHDWLWKTTWNKNKSYATIYQVKGNETILQLAESLDGLKYKYLTTINVPESPNETTLRFDDDNKMVAIIRRGGGNSHGYIGVSEFPYTEWNLKELNVKLGGPNFEFLPNGKIVCGTREYPIDFNEKMILSFINEDGYSKKLVTLPSAGDCSYPGLLIHDNILYVSYYSTHEEKTAIYFAKVRLDKLVEWTDKKITPDPYVTKNREGNIELECNLKNSTIRYTLDGSLPTVLSGIEYTKEIKINRTSLLRAIAYSPNLLESNIISVLVGQDVFQEAIKTEYKYAPGLAYEYYEGNISQVNDLNKLKSSKTGIIKNISILEIEKQENFGIIYTGYLNIPEDGFYTFYLSSNDGSTLELNEEIIINNDGPHGNREVKTSISLRKGMHKISVNYFQMGGGSNLELYWKSDNFSKEEIPSEVLFH